MKSIISHPLEPQVVDLQHRQSRSLFMIVPSDVIERIFSLLSRSDLFHFEQACWSHSTLTDQVWKVLRQEDFFNHLDWQVCRGSHRSNYLLSKVIIHYVKELLPFNIKLSERQHNKKVLEKQRNKFALMREKFPPFNAFMQLTELKKPMEIPEELADQLKKEASFELITELYQFARQCSFAPQKTLCNQFNQDLKVRIKTAIQQGTTCLGVVAIHFFHHFSLLNDQNQFINSTVVEFALEAFKKGDLFVFSEMREGKYHDLFPAKFSHLSNLHTSLSDCVSYASDELIVSRDFRMLFSIEKLLDWAKETPFRKYPITSSPDISPLGHFRSKWIACQEENLPPPILNLYQPQRIYVYSGRSLFRYSTQSPEEGLKKAERVARQMRGEPSPERVPDRMKGALQPYETVIESLNNVRMPLHLLHSLFRFHIFDNNWKEADQYLERILKKNNQLFSSDVLLAAAKMKVHLQQWDKADAFYKALFDVCERQRSYKILLEPNLYQSTGYRIPGPLLLKAGQLRSQLKKWEEAKFFYDRYVQLYGENTIDFVTVKDDYIEVKSQLRKLEFIEPLGEKPKKSSFMTQRFFWQ